MAETMTEAEKIAAAKSAEHEAKVAALKEKYKGVRTYKAMGHLFVGGRSIDPGEVFTVENVLPGKLWKPIEEVVPEKPEVIDLTAKAPSAPVVVVHGQSAPAQKNQGHRSNDKTAI